MRRPTKAELVRDIGRELGGLIYDLQKAKDAKSVRFKRTRSIKQKVQNRGREL